MGGGHDDAPGEVGARAGRGATPVHPAQEDARAQVGAPAAGAIRRTPDELLSTIGHDLRVPLNGLVGMVEMLRGTRLDGEQRCYVDALQRSADALVGVVDEMLDLSSIHGGRVGLARGAFSPQRVAQDVIALLRPRAERKGLSLLFWCRAMPERLLGDSIRLQQVVTKLLSHAIESTTRGEVRLELSALPQPDGRWRLQGTVADTGAGPDAAQRHRPEGLFAGEAAGTAFREVSSELGLAVCARLLALMGGTLGLDSRPGEGTRLRFEAVFECEAPTGPTSGAPATLAGLRVLVVDDDAVSRTLALGVLGRLGIAARVAHDAREAIVEVAEHAFDVVVMDVRMPGLDGLEATRAIRALPSGANQPWIVALTAALQVDDRSRCIESGMDDFIVKPFRAETLKDTLQRALQRLGSSPA
ncbi:MAG: response regulator [Burkholderiales bacterium]|nr:response regulator [Burkholderiales bacterium]